MKIALYIEDGLEQIVLTPESDTEKAILGKLHDGSRQLHILKGSFYDCRGGWKRFGEHRTHSAYGHSEENDESTMIVLRPAEMVKPDHHMTSLAIAEAESLGLLNTRQAGL